MTNGSIVLLGCGDVGPCHEPVESFCTLARPVFATADLRFAQCERMCTDKGSLQPRGSPTGRTKPHMDSLYDYCGFNVVSVASNHAMDWGGDALLDAIARLQKKDIHVMGGGRNIEAARKPAIIEKNGVKVAFLAYCSILHPGWEAGPDKAGIAPMRVHTYYEPIESQPGLPPRVVTIPYLEDLEAMVEDIRKAKAAAHAVIVSMHWGLHFVPRVIAEYQTIVAKAAFRAGADLILGHHAHVAKAIEVFDGKACFYSLGNFIMSDFAASQPRFIKKLKFYGVTANVDESPRCPHGKDSKHSLIVKAVLSCKGIEKLSFLPVQIDRELRPEVLLRNDPRFDESVNFMEWVSEGFNHKFAVEGDEVVVAT